MPDEIFEDLGFPVDCDMDGKGIRRNATITQESRQRAKNLTHLHQAELRNEKQELTQVKVVQKEADKKNKNSSQLIFNRKCEDALRALMTEQAEEQTEISEFTLEHFSNVRRQAKGIYRS